MLLLFAYGGHLDKSLSVLAKNSFRSTIVHFLPLDRPFCHIHVKDDLSY